MFHLDNNSGISSMPTPAAAQSNATRWFTEGAGTGVPSWPGQDWFNIVQAELLNVLIDAGIAPEKAAFNQLSLAVKSLIGKEAFLKVNLLSEIKESGATQQKKARENLDITDASTEKKGLVQLSNATNSTSEALAATPKAVKAANDNAEGRVPLTRKVNNKPLSGDITLSADDVVAVPSVIRGVINGSMTMASANKTGWWQVAVPDTSKVSDFPKKPDGSRLYGYGYMLVWITGGTWFQHYYAHHGEVAYRQDWNTGPSASVEWNVDYNTANKPTAAEVDAVSASGGGTFKGVVNFNSIVRIDKSYPGLVLRDADTGDSVVGKDIILEASGSNVRLLFRKKDVTDNQLMLSFPKVTGTLYSTGNKPSAGDVGAYTKAESDARYVSDVQLGAGTSKTTWNTSGNWPKTAGYVITSVWKDANDYNLDGVVYAPLQKKIGSTWYTVSGGLA
ncbi:hypothetical protein EX075_13750 [Salmonella enterica]|nr:hypothetical protein [Salmonella enterica]